MRARLTRWGFASLLLVLLIAPATAPASSDTRKLHSVRQQRARYIHCREAAQRARAAAQQLREAAQQPSLDIKRVLTLRAALAEQVAALAVEHRAFVQSLTPEQAASVREALAYTDDVHRRLEVHLAAIEETARPEKVPALRRHCRVLERDLKDWNDQHVAISKAVGFDVD